MKRGTILSLMICGALCLGWVVPGFTEDTPTATETNKEKSSSMREGKLKPKHPYKKLRHKAKMKHKKHKKEVKQNKD